MYIWSSSRRQSEYVISEFWTQCQGLKTIVHDDKNYYFFFLLTEYNYHFSDISIERVKVHLDTVRFNL